MDHCVLSMIGDLFERELFPSFRYSVRFGFDEKPVNHEFLKRGFPKATPVTSKTPARRKQNFPFMSRFPINNSKQGRNFVQKRSWL